MANTNIFDYIKPQAPPSDTADRILTILRDANGGWVKGIFFLNLGKPILGYRARICELQQKGYKIESAFRDGDKFVSYRLHQSNINYNEL